MKKIPYDTEYITETLNRRGYMLCPAILNAAECETFRQLYKEHALYRKTVVMERHRFGLGEYRYFTYPLPPLLQTLREQVYPLLVPAANLWMQVLNIERRFPARHEELLAECRAAGQHKATPLILRYGPDGYNTLHQDLYGECYFPFQAVFFLSEAGHDHTGGEFVLTEQQPRAQSRAVVLQPAKGDMLIFTTAFRPLKGSRGYYRAAVKHGVSTLHSGERYTLGLIFHDALS